MNKRRIFLLILSAMVSFNVYCGDVLIKYFTENNFKYEQQIYHKDKSSELKGENTSPRLRTYTKMATTTSNLNHSPHDLHTIKVKFKNMMRREHFTKSFSGVNDESKLQMALHKSEGINVPAADLPHGFCYPVVPARHVAYHSHPTPYVQKPENNYVINQRQEKVTLLNFEKVLSEQTPVVWPIIYFHTDGRLGNVLNVYATALAMANRHNATFVTGDYEYRVMLKLLDPNALQLYIINTNFVEAAKASSEVEYSGQAWTTFDFWVDYEQAIVAAIQLHREKGIRQLMPFIGYPNRMHLLGRHMDLVRQNIRIRADLREKAQSFLSHKKSDMKREDVSFIGFHIRRTDYVKIMRSKLGGWVPGEKYYQAVLAHYRQKFAKPMFIVASDDFNHTKRYLAQEDDVVFTDSKSDVEDMAILAACSATAMTVGSFGWWAGFLSGGEVVYTMFTRFKETPDAHPISLGPLGYETWHGIFANGTHASSKYHNDLSCCDVSRGHKAKELYPFCFN